MLLDTPLVAFQDQFYNFSYWVRVNVSLYKAPQAAALSPFLISPTHPTHTWRDRPPHRELRPLLFLTSVWLLYRYQKGQNKVIIQVVLK